MSSLPVIVGFGGINPAGRSSFHHSYRRMISEVLDTNSALETYTDLAMLMNLISYEDGKYKTAEGQEIDLAKWVAENKGYINDHTLIRELEGNLFDPHAVKKNVRSHMAPAEGETTSFILKSRQLPKTLPDHWQAEPLVNDPDKVKVTVKGGFDVLIPDEHKSLVNSAGQLPTGFLPDKLYPSRNHPRGLQLAVYAASDAIQSLGMDWEQVIAHVSPDQIGVYSSSSMGQLDWNGIGGMVQAQSVGKRVTSKQCPLSMPQMPADFVNAYIVGSVGGTGANIGACATYLYNLKQGIEDIRSGRKRVVVVGVSEAPITPEVMEGYRIMGALAQDKELMELDGGAVADYRRACRPFSSNCGFTLAEASHYVVLFDDELALTLGANIYGAVGDVFVNADGFKKSISAPGVGNYVTMAKAVAATRAILGEDALQKTYVQAHGTGTPQNRVTESRILNEISKTFGMGQWQVAATKSYVGHPLGPASGDQLITSLGVWKYGYIPGIKTIDHLADDLERSHLDILMDHREVGVEGMDAAIINSKGFGGNNASASILAPHRVKNMLETKHGKNKFAAYEKLNEGVCASAKEYDQACLKGQSNPIYHFGKNVQGDADVSITPDEVRIKGYENPISLELDNPYDDMC